MLLLRSNYYRSTNIAAVISVLGQPSNTSDKHLRLSYSSFRAQKLVTLAQASEKPSFPHERNELRETSLLKRERLGFYRHS